MLAKLTFLVLLGAQQVLLKPVEPGFTNLEVGMIPSEISTVSGSIDEHLEDSGIILHVFFRDNVEHLHKGCIKNLPKLKSIVAIEKGLKSISSNAFGNLPSIEYITIVQNKISYIPKHVFSNIPVQEISFQDNEIARIEEGAFAHLPNLKRLYLQGNKLTAWNPNWVGNTSPNLNAINLDNNAIKHVQAGAFKIFDKLEDVQITNNTICSIDAKAFEGNFWLEVLDLDENDIYSLNADMVIGRSTPSEDYLSLRLRSNHIKALPEKFLKSLKNTIVFLNENPISCKCDLEMEKWVKNSHVDVIYSDCNHSGNSCADEPITSQC